jgi:hypothetical protein
VLSGSVFLLIQGLPAAFLLVHGLPFGMIRILLVILAVVTALLAFVLQWPALYLVALAALLGTLVAVVVSLVRRRQRTTEPYAPRPTLSVESREDLGALGISDVRVRESSRPDKPSDGDPAPSTPPVEESEPAVVAAPAEVPAPEVSSLAEARPGPTLIDSGIGLVTPRKKPRLPVEAVNPPHLEDSVLPCLLSLRAAVDATTVCILSQEEMTLRYQVEAIVSRNSYARTHGRFSTRTPLIGATMAQKPITVQRVDAQGFPPAQLGYYTETIAIRQVAFAPLPLVLDERSYFLVVDTMMEGGLDAARKQHLIPQYARLLASLMGPDADETPRLEPPSAAPAQPRPRREIVAEEIALARRLHHPLALALVYLNSPETETEQVTAVEAALEASLRRHTPQGRIERFGELTFGVFYRNQAPEVEAWAMQLQDEVTHQNGLLVGELCVGAALLHDRHTSPDDLRADATTALREAYETGTCTILE